MGEAALGINQYTYARHLPEETVLYKIVQENLQTFLAQVEQETGYPLPDFVVKEFEEYLKCGILAHGFLRAQCEKCHKESLVAFSCKRRGLKSTQQGAHPLPNTVENYLTSFIKPLRKVIKSQPYKCQLRNTRQQHSPTQKTKKLRNPLNTPIVRTH